MGMLSHSLLITIISIPMAIYNIYCLYKKNYILYFSIGEQKQNIRNYKNESFKFKVKFALYTLIALISIITLLLQLVYYLLDKLLNDKNAIDSVFRYFGIIE